MIIYSIIEKYEQWENSTWRIVKSVLDKAAAEEIIKEFRNKPTLRETLRERHDNAMNEWDSNNKTPNPEFTERRPVFDHSREKDDVYLVEHGILCKKYNRRRKDWIKNVLKPAEKAFYDFRSKSLQEIRKKISEEIYEEIHLNGYRDEHAHYYIEENELEIKIGDVQSRSLPGF